MRESENSSVRTAHIHGKTCRLKAPERSLGYLPGEGVPGWNDVYVVTKYSIAHVVIRLENKG